MNLVKPKLIFVFFFVTSSLWSLVSFSMTDADTNAVRAVYEKQRNGVLNELKSTIAKSTGTGIVSACLAYFFPVAGAAAAATGWGYWFANDISNALAYCGITHKTGILELAENLNRLELEFTRQQGRLIEYNKKRLSTLIMEARKLIGYGIRPIYVSDRMYPESILQTITEIVKFPTTMSKPCDKKEAFAKLKEHLKTYSKPLATEVIKAVKQMHLLADLANEDNMDSGKAAFLFLGEAGVGKTVTAQMIAKVLGRPFCRITFAGTSLEQFYGTSSKDRLKGVGGRLGHLARCFVQPDEGQKALDPIIFIDEGQDAFGSNETSEFLISLLKDLSDPNILEVRENSLDIRVSIKNTVFIVGSNIDLSRKNEALASRLTKINFTGLTKEQKRQIADDKFPGLCRHWKYIPTCKNEEEQDKLVIAQIINLDASPGARVLERVLNDYILHKVTLKDKCIIKLPCREFNIAQSIINRGGRINDNRDGRSGSNIDQN